MTGVAWALAVPLIVFLTFVAPIWLFLHYRSKKAMGVGLNQKEQHQLKELSHSAHQLQQRVQHLESILDQESPEWRNYWDSNKERS